MIFSMFSFFAIVILKACIYCIEDEEDRPKQPGILNDQIDVIFSGDSPQLRVDFLCVRSKLLMC